MMEMVEGALRETSEQATGIDFGSEDLARMRLHIPARLKGGGIRGTSALRTPAFVGAILDIPPICIDMKDKNGDMIKGVHTAKLGDAIGMGAFDRDGYTIARFLQIKT
jgi:hypothetical protein